MVTCLLTSQQRSGPDSIVSKFVSQKPFPLGLDHCRAAPSLVAEVTAQLSGSGIRRFNVIANEIAENLITLDGGGWAEVESAIGSVDRDTNAAMERNAAERLRKVLRGIGPKQSRNLLQILGLTRFEIPIDSRITNWLNNFGFPLTLTSSGLADPAYYGLVSDGFQELCAAADVLPCLMDAAIFSSVDE